MALNLFAIPPGRPFLDTLAAEWLHERGDDPLEIAKGLILTPTRRAARALAEAFLRVSSHSGLLLPRIVGLGALDEAPLALASALDVPAAVDPHLRLSVLTHLILRMRGAGGAPTSVDRAWPLARELANLMDEADRSEIDLATLLPNAADPAYAAHWARTLEFLQIVTHAWPAWLRENGVINPGARQVALLNAQSRAWELDGSTEPVMIAGTTAGIPSVARLSRVVARMPNGCVVLPVLDTLMDDTAWTAIEDSHPQAGLAALLAALNATRDDIFQYGAIGRQPDGAPSPRLLTTGGAMPSVTSSPLAHDAGRSPRHQPKAGAMPLFGGLPSRNAEPPADSAASAVSDRAGWGASGGAALANRFALLSRSLLPASALSTWQKPFEPDPAGLQRLSPRDAQEEAEAIAMVLREAVETPGRNAALVTPDRDLAGRVAAALLRHGIVADDSAGEKLSETPPAVFLRLLAQAVTEALAPVPLLALMKHPLAAAGLTPAACRHGARTLELRALRGPRPAPGLVGLRRAIASAGDELNGFLQRVEGCLEPALRCQASMAIAPADAVAGLIAAGERLATTDSESGEARLWAAEEGAALANLLTAALVALPNLPEQPSDAIPRLLDALLQGEVVRTRRALRGRGGTEHPRVFIWGLLEARLQSVDVMVLGGLVETVWPPAPEPGPWLSRPMRASVGLPSPESEIGSAAHDFLSAAMAAPKVVLSSPLRRDGAPAVPARWLTRLDALLAGAGTALPEHPAVGWARRLDVRTEESPSPVRPPRPCPPVMVRPSRLTVTEIETWLQDPYAIYAKHILRLPALKPLDQETDAADFGLVVHRGIHLFVREHGIAWPDDGVTAMRRAMRQALAESLARPALAAWWEPRLDRIAAWIAAIEKNRREGLPIQAVTTEQSGAWELQRPGRRFTLVARADRIERREDGTLAILDYKTGSVPSQKDVVEARAPQLPLEAAIANGGGFGPEWQARTAELTYWHLTGGFEPGKATPLFKTPDDLQETVATAIRGLESLIDQFDQPDRCYLAQPWPGWRPRFPDYAQLARVAEWSAVAEAEEA